MSVWQMFSWPFMQRALIAGVLVSLCAALLGGVPPATLTQCLKPMVVMSFLQMAKVLFWTALKT